MSIHEVKALLEIAEVALKFPGLKHLHDQALALLIDVNLPSVEQPEQSIVDTEGEDDYE